MTVSKLKVHGWRITTNYTVLPMPTYHLRKQDGDTLTTRQDKEDKVDCVYKELAAKHSSKYDSPRLCLLSQMITAGLHNDYDNPPNVPAFSGSTPKKPRMESLTEWSCCCFWRCHKGEDPGDTSCSSSMHCPVECHLQNLLLSCT